MINYHDISYNGIWLAERFRGNVIISSTIPQGIDENGGRTIEVPIEIADNVLDTIDMLNDIFREKNKRLILKVQPDRYYIASITENITPTSAMRNARLTLKFYADEGEAYSTNAITKIFQNPTEMVLTNPGTADAYPIISVKHSTDNGYLALYNETGAFVAGNREDIDMDEKPARKILMKSSTSFSGKAVTSTPTGDLAGGTLKVAANGEVTLAAKGGWGDGKHWAGGFNVFPIESSSAGVGTQRFYSRFQVAAETGKTSQTGLLKVIYMDANNRIVAMYEVHKASTSKNEADFLMSYGGNSFRRFKNFKFTPSNKEKENPFRTKTHGSIDFEKIGAKLRFFWWGKYYDLVVPELADVAIAKVGIWIGQYGTRDLIANHYFTVLKLKSMMCEITNNDKISGVKNLFLAGDVFKLDNGTTDITINDYPRADLFSIGGSFLRLPPGESKLYLQKSEWSGDVEVTVEVKGRWL
ncbi:distal tail protein Dit [Streptococcus ovis]|uniref:distal tail protein Dit n=1 Tax=Streptococcus ovis TaxID=82806 RepID=UPI000379C700|nr:distal tail protein Dit [Streptococcus ovis]